MIKGTKPNVINMNQSSINIEEITNRLKKTNDFALAFATPSMQTLNDIRATILERRKNFKITEKKLDLTNSLKPKSGKS